MILLNEKFLTPYLNEVFLHLPFKVVCVIEAKEITAHTNANFLFRIVLQTQHGKKIVFIKQARAYNKRAWRQGKIIPVDNRRIVGEVKMLAFLAKLWGQKFVPRVYWFDRKNSIFIMSDVADNKKLLVEEFLKNHVHPESGVTLGRLFAILHASTYATKKEFSSSRSWKKQLLKKLVMDYWATALKKYILPKQVNNFLAESRRIPQAAVWADPIYRNIFVRGRDASFVDFDHACTYDPAFDCGILLAHWIWMMLKGGRVESDSRIFIRAFIRNYRRYFLKIRQYHKSGVDDILRRSLQWAGFYMVTRIDGKSGSYFSSNKKWEATIRQTGLDLFMMNTKVEVVARLYSLTAKNL